MSRNSRRIYQSREARENYLLWWLSNSLQGINHKADGTEAPLLSVFSCSYQVQWLYGIANRIVDAC